MKAKVWLGIIVLALGALMIVIPGSRPLRAAGPWYVAPGGDDVLNDCLSAGAPCATINGAIGKATAGDTICVAVGTYTGSGDEVVLLDKNVTLSGGWSVNFGVQDGKSIIDGQQTRQGIVVSSSVTSLVEHFYIRNGDATGGSGGGIHNSGTLTVDRCTLADNAPNGIYNNGWDGGGDLVVSNSVVSGSRNIGIHGDGGSTTLRYSSVTDNAGIGVSGAMGRMTLNGSTVSDNAGTGIRSLHNQTTLDSSTVSGNTERGIVVDQGTLILNNSTVSGNTADECGGGIHIPGGNNTVYLNSSTVSGNSTSSTRAGGICNDDEYISNNVTLQNTILAGNSAPESPNCVGTIQTLGHNLIGDTSGCTFTPGTGDLTNVSAALGPLTGSPGYHPLLPGSVALNAGDPAGCSDHLGSPLPFDQRGMPRVGRCDIGSYEAGLAGTKQVRGVVEPGGLVTYTITMVNEEGNLDLTNVLVTDTLPNYHTFAPGSFSASNGTGGAVDGVVTWIGSVFSSGHTVLTFAAALSDTIPRGIVVTNTALMSNGGKPLARHAVFDTFYHTYLPMVTRGYCGPLLYADDFGDLGSGWPIGDSGNVLYEYLDGEYRILLRTTGVWAGARPGFKAADYAVSVDIRHSPESGLGSYGLIFGLSDDWSEFLSFEILPHNTSYNYVLYRYRSGSWTPLAWGFSGSIQWGDATNRLTIVRDGPLTLAYANGQLLESFPENTYTGSRHVGLIASSYGQANVDVRFDNFVVYPAWCGSSIAALGAAGEMPSVQATDLALPSHQEGTRNSEGR